MKKLWVLLLVAVFTGVLLVVVSKAPQKESDESSAQLFSREVIEEEKESEVVGDKESSTIGSIIEYFDNLFFAPDYFKDVREPDLFEAVMNGE